MNKVDQDNKLLKKLAKINVEQSQKSTSKSKTPTRDKNTKTNKSGPAQVAQPRMVKGRTNQAMVQAILASNSQESDCNLDSENDQPDIDVLLTAQSADEWRESPVCTVIISERPLQQIFLLK